MKDSTIRSELQYCRNLVFALAKELGYKIWPVSEIDIRVIKAENTQSDCEFAALANALGYEFEKTPAEPAKIVAVKKKK